VREKGWAAYIQVQAALTPFFQISVVSSARRPTDESPHRGNFGPNFAPRVGYPSPANLSVHRSDHNILNQCPLLYPSPGNSQELVFGGHFLRTTLLNRQKAVDGEYVFPGRHGRHKTIQNNRALEAAFKRAGLTDVSSHNMSKTFATRLLSRGAAITDVQHLVGHASVKTTERAYAAFVKNERFKQAIDLLDTPIQPMLKIVR